MRQQFIKAHEQGLVAARYIHQQAFIGIRQTFVECLSETRFSSDGNSRIPPGPGSFDVSATPFICTPMIRRLGSLLTGDTIAGKDIMGTVFG